MRKEKTELVFIIDESGSMAGLERDTLGGYNRLLNEQKKLEGTCTVTTIFFNTTNKLKHDRVLLTEIAELSAGDYEPGGATALYDAIGYGISKTSSMLSGVKKVDQPTTIMVVIITDGEENSSREYNNRQIHELIAQKEKMGWHFEFLGANIDSVATASTLGIRKEHAHAYEADSDGLNVMYSRVNALVKAVRTKKK